MARSVLVLAALAVAVVLVSNHGDDDMTAMDEALSFRVICLLMPDLNPMSRDP